MDCIEKGFAQASEASKLLITLSTALVAFCATLVNVKAADVTLFSPSSACEKLVLVLIWLALLGAIAAGVWVQLAITDVLSSAQASATAPSPWNRKITVPFKLQIVAFGLAMLFLVVYSAIKLFMGNG